MTTPAGIRQYLEKRAARPFRGMDDVIHRIHAGTEDEAALSIKDIQQFDLAPEQGAPDGLVHYLQKRAERPLRGISDDIHTIHAGTEDEATISLADLQAWVAATSADNDAESDGVSLGDLITSIEDEFRISILTIMPSRVDVEPYGETYWLVTEDASGAREIQWLAADRLISEAEGPIASDCPAVFFELVPPTNPEWRTSCR